MKKKGILLLGLIMLVSMFGEVRVSADDYSKHWAKNSIEAALKKGYLTGLSDGSIRPNEAISRAEFVKLINQALNFSESGEIHFIDVKKEDWFYQEVAIGVKAGYIKGVSNTEFRPDDRLTREQAAKIIALAEKYEKASYGSAFVDEVDISPWAKEAIAVCVEKNVLQGMPDGKFVPKRELTRGEAITIIEKALTVTENNPKDAVIIQTNGTLKYRTFKNIEIARSVGQGSAKLKQVKIKGDLVIRGGGKNSIYLEDVVIEGKLIVEKEDGEIRIYVTGESNISKVMLHSGAILEEEKIAEGYQGIHEVQVTGKIPHTQRVTGLGKMIFTIENKHIMIEGNGKTLQNGDKSKDKKVSPSAPKNSPNSSNPPSVKPAPNVPSPSPAPNVPSPAPAPAPSPSPEPETNINGDPKDSPVFIIDSDHSGLGIYKDAKNYKHKLVVKTVSAAAIYFVVGKSENDQKITKEDVLKGQVPLGEAKEFYILQTQGGIQSQTLIEAKPGESIYLVATNAKQEERLEKLNLATRVRIFTIH